MSRTNRNKYSSLIYFLVSYDFTFEPIQSYIIESNNMIDKLGDELEDKFEKWDKQREHNDDMPDAVDYYEEDIIKLQEFSYILYESMFISIYSQFEKELKKLALHCQKIENISSGPRKKGRVSYIGIYNDYIMNTMKIDLVKLNPVWQKINFYRIIRNALTHGDSKITLPKDIPVELFNKFPDLKFEDTISIAKIISIDFLLIFLKDTKMYLEGLCNEIIEEKA